MEFLTGGAAQNNKGTPPHRSMRRNTAFFTTTEFRPLARVALYVVCKKSNEFKMYSLMVHTVKLKKTQYPDGAATEPGPGLGFKSRR